MMQRFLDEAKRRAAADPALGQRLADQCQAHNSIVATSDAAGTTTDGACPAPQGVVPHEEEADPDDEDLALRRPAAPHSKKEVKAATALDKSGTHDKSILVNKRIGKKTGASSARASDDRDL